jgi:hypothetical protein
MAVFIIYGSHWGSLAYTQDPIHQTTSAFEQLGGANGVAYNASQGFHNVTMSVLQKSFLNFLTYTDVHPGQSHVSSSSSEPSA